MARYSYEFLSPQDAAFLVAEGPRTPMHIGAVFIGDAGPLRNTFGGIDAQRVRAFIASRLHHIPRYRQVLAYTPVRQRPIWVDDPHFNLEYHVRHTALPQPGDAAQWKQLVGRIASQQLDRRRPLWEFWVVEGVDQGKRFAIISKVHHCMVDGISGTEMMTLLMSLAPDEKPQPVPPFVPRPLPSRAELAAADVRDAALTPFEVARRLSDLLRPARREELGNAVRGAAHLIGRGLVPASETPLNRPIGPHRRFECLALELGRVRAVKDRLGGTVNDVVLASVAGAMRRFLLRRLVDVSRLDFRVSTPVSVRGSAEHGALGNRVSAWIVPLPVDDPDALRRLERIRATTGRLKQTNEAGGADLLSTLTEWSGTTLLSLGTSFQSLGRPHNLVVSNVPGPQTPLYLVGAPLLEAYPLGPLFQNQAVVVALFSYAGRVFFGLNADADRMPDLAALRDDLERSFAELAALAGAAA